MSNQFCISCNEEGHTYLSCPNRPFASMAARAFGVADLLSAVSQVENSLQSAETRRWIAEKTIENLSASEIIERLVSNGYKFEISQHVGTAELSGLYGKKYYSAVFIKYTSSRVQNTSAAGDGFFEAVKEAAIIILMENQL